MTLVYRRDLNDEPGLHAILIGVGAYPAVGDQLNIESAYHGAKSVADFLIKHADQLRPRLQSVELLLNKPGDDDTERMGIYEWPQNDGPPFSGFDPRLDMAVELPNKANVEAAGAQWWSRISQNPQNSAFFYACGHGVATTSRNVVFLSDFRSNPGREPWGPYIDLQREVMRIRRHDAPESAYFFADACQEVILEADVAEADDAREFGEGVYIVPSAGLRPEKNKAYLLVPGPRGAFAFSGAPGYGGRFTQVLIRALEGCAASDMTGAGQWGIDLERLHSRMKLLYSLRTEWTEQIEPTPLYPFICNRPLVQYSQPPKIPICVQLDPPHAMQAASRIAIINGQNIEVEASELAAMPPPRPDLWVAWPQASTALHYILADIPADPAWPNAAGRTPVNITEMRVLPPITHGIR